MNEQAAAGASGRERLTIGGAALSANGVLGRSVGTRLHTNALDGLFILNGLHVGGSETKTVRIVNALHRHGVLAGIVSLNGPGELAAAIDPAIPVWYLHRRGKFSVLAARMLRQLIREQRPSIVLSVNLYPALYLSLATAGLAQCPRTAGMMNTTVFARRDAWRPVLYGPFLRRLDAIVYGCELQREAWRSHLGSMEKRSAVIYNGVDTDYFVPWDETQSSAARMQLGISPHAFVVGSVGRLAPEKNQAVLIDAVSELRSRSLDVHLLLVGEGAMRRDLQHRAEERDVLAHVTFAGAHRDVRPALSAMDVFVLPSTHIETFSNAALEAMAMCKPVVLSRIGGALEMVREGIDGFTLELATLSDSLPSLLIRLQAHRAWSRRLGLAARARVIQHFSLQTMVERYAELIDSSAAPAFPVRKRS